MNGMRFQVVMIQVSLIYGQLFSFSSYESSYSSSSHRPFHSSRSSRQTIIQDCVPDNDSDIQQIVSKEFKRGSTVHTNVCVYNRIGVDYMVTLPDAFKIIGDFRRWLLSYGKCLYPRISINHFDPNDCPPRNKNEDSQLTSNIARRVTPIQDDEDRSQQNQNLFPEECGISQTFSFTRDRIWNGKITAIEHSPWQVSLFQDDKFSCGGSIITILHIMTAAHCVYSKEDEAPISADRIMIKAGSADRDTMDINNIFNVQRIFIHKFYNPTKHKRHDISVLLLESELTFSTEVFPICMPKKEEVYEFGKLCEISGWGNTQTSVDGNRMLLSGKVGIISQSKCVASYRTAKITRRMFCAAGSAKNRSDTCQGDSGGPLVCYNKGNGLYYLYGITSFGLVCGGGSPGVYTKGSTYVDWTEDKIRRSTIGGFETSSLQDDYDYEYEDDYE